MRKKIDTHSLEDDLCLQEKRESRSVRKRAVSNDRSKFKKTNSDKEKPKNLLGSLQGRILSIFSNEILVQGDNGSCLICTLKGVLKKEKQRKKNIVAVGDLVTFDPINDKQGVICSVLPRSSKLVRASALTQQKEHIIAANIDQVLITCSVFDPPLRLGIVDRYIIATKKGGMEPVLVINKIDLLDKDPLEALLFEEVLAIYKKEKIVIIPVSIVTGVGIDILKKQMHNKASVFSGPSGVGKSSLINAVTGLNLAVRETVARTKKGAHTTTKASLIPLEFGGFCIDTPGIKSFGLWEIDKSDLEGYFKEIAFFAKKCRFTSCNHIQEPGCAVIEAVSKGKLLKKRYDSYKDLFQEATTKHLKR